LLLALPEDVLRALSPDYLATLPADTRAALRKRLDQP
jgi:adenylate kinase